MAPSWGDMVTIQVSFSLTASASPPVAYEVALKEDLVTSLGVASESNFKGFTVVSTFVSRRRILSSYVLAVYFDVVFSLESLSYTSALDAATDFAEILAGATFKSILEISLGAAITIDVSTVSTAVKLSSTPSPTSAPTKQESSPALSFHAFMAIAAIIGLIILAGPCALVRKMVSKKKIQGEASTEPTQVQNNPSDDDLHKLENGALFIEKLTSINENLPSRASDVFVKIAESEDKEDKATEHEAKTTLWRTLIAAESAWEESEKSGAVDVALITKLVQNQSVIQKKLANVEASREKAGVKVVRAQAKSEYATTEIKTNKSETAIAREARGSCKAKKLARARLKIEAFLDKREFKQFVGKYTGSPRSRFRRNKATSPRDDPYADTKDESAGESAFASSTRMTSSAKREYYAFTPSPARLASFSPELARLSAAPGSTNQVVQSLGTPMDGNRRRRRIVSLDDDPALFGPG
jgi:hypothetical protein